MGTPVTIKEKEVTLEQLLKPYQPQLVPDEDDFEVQPHIWGNEAREVISLLKLYVQQQWDSGMLSPICEDIEDETAVAVQRDLNNLECHITAIQLRKTYHQTSIKSFFPPVPTQDAHSTVSGYSADLIAAFGKSATLPDSDLVGHGTCRL